ncbi:hypothetical protein ACWD26_14310 [Streptomyces sp. NPDC002787]
MSRRLRSVDWDGWDRAAEQYRQHFERVSSTALSPAVSRDLIARITHEL